jgi:hypothetical protein
MTMPPEPPLVRVVVVVSPAAQPPPPISPPALDARLVVYVALAELRPQTSGVGDRPGAV